MRIAAIDIGTNSLHMMVCRIRPDLSFEVIDREKDMVRLGMGGLDGRRLAESSMAAAVTTLSKFTRIAEAQGVDEIVAAATSAVREAENGADFVATVQRELGLRVRVISGTEEARLIHLAAAYAIQLGKRPSIVVDIGGGSTEITLGTSDRLIAGKSFKLGVIRLTEKYGQSDPLARRDERRMVRRIKSELGDYLAQLSKRRIDRVIGTSGTIQSLGAMVTGHSTGEDLRQVRVSAKALRRLRKRLTSLTLQQRLKLPSLDPRRADLAPAGAVLLDTILDGLDADEITLCDFALREGLVLDYIARNAQHIRTVDRYPDVRRRSVIELAERCNYLAPHAQQVARLALAIFDATRSRHGLGSREREWLEYAAILHDVGTHISYERHHKHSYYLIRHGGLRGFEPEEIEIIALVARYHRQATPKKSHAEYAALPERARRVVRVLAAIVRLAEGLDRSHGQVVSDLDLRSRNGRVAMRLTSRGDADLELWAADRHAAALAHELDVTLAFELAGRRRRRGPARVTTNLHR
ncbi:MAG TPA: Ppx/GppA phosphatase family protein [Vicinamibacterales bacterium]|nr:Ppx/GppA phosphatase family protein [Vicinamibacterales bacterium]